MLPSVSLQEESTRSGSEGLEDEGALLAEFRGLEIELTEQEIEIIKKSMDYKQPGADDKSKPKLTL